MSMLAKWDSLMQAFTLMSLLVKKKNVLLSFVTSRKRQLTTCCQAYTVQTPKTKETLVELAKQQLQGKINFKQVVCKETVLVDGVAE